VLPQKKSNTKELNNSEEEEISNTEFQKIILRVINELKDETQNLVTELKRKLMNI
jgi:hypothetical protein